MKNLFVRILACILVFTMAFAFAACKDDAADETPAPTPDTTPDTGDTPGDDWFVDDPGTGDTPSGDEPCIACVDDNADLVCDVCGGPVEKPWDPWDEVKYFAIPNSSITTSVLDIAADGKIKSLTLANGSTINLEFDYTPAAASSFEMKFEGETVKVAFAADGKIAILKGETVLATSAAAYTAAAKVVIDYNGTAITVKVGGADAVSATYTAPAANADLYLIAGAGAKFENAKATLGGSALEFETRHGTTWEVIDSDDYNDGAFYTGYSGNANNYKALALINNVDFENAKKITISADIANGADHRVVGADGKPTGNADRGFLVEVWNTNGEGDTNPLFYENKNCSFFKVFLAGHSVSASMGKYGATNFENDAQNRDGGWMSLPGGSAGLGQPAETATKEDGPKNDAGKLVYQAENTYVTMDKGGEDAYINFKVEWDRENLVMSYYYNNVLVKSVEFTRDIFVNDGSGMGITAASGDVYFRNFVLIVE